MPTQAQQLIALMNYMRGEQEKFYAALPEGERTRNGTWEEWAPKDALAHLNFWQKNMVTILDHLDQAPPDLPPFEERNRTNYLNNAARPWSDIHADNAASYGAIIEHVSKLSDDDLNEVNRFPRIVNNTLKQSILGNTFSHNALHLGELFDKYGGPMSGLDFQEQATRKMIEYDPSERTRGLALYNLACAYALANKPARTVELLQEAFGYRPDLVEFSKEDTDFNLVRERPEFQALYAAPLPQA